MNLLMFSRFNEVEESYNDEIHAFGNGNVWKVDVGKFLLIFDVDKFFLIFRILGLRTSWLFVKKRLFILLT